MKLLGCFLMSTALWGALSRPEGAAALQSRLVYEKIPATASGLDLAHPVEVPVAQVSVELATADGKIVDVTDTDENGVFSVQVPDDKRDLQLTVLARSGKREVIDPDTGGPQGIIFNGVDLDPWPEKCVIPDYLHLSGSFNILATLQKADRRLEQIEPGLPLADRPLVIYWSPDVNRGTYATERALFINGNRDINADEFDDSVVLGAYAEYLLRCFSPISGPKGATHAGERVDPRQAWVEGWKLFFAQAVLDTPVSIDTQGANGSQAITTDLDQDEVDGDAPGYWSAWDVGSALWDFDTAGGKDGPHLGLGLGPIWQVMREYFPQQVFPSLITLADGLIRQDPSREAGITEILSRRQIQYRFGKEPPVPEPFLRPLASGVAVTGQVDSLTSHKTNLLEAADYYLVRKESTDPLRVQFTLTDEPSPGDGALELELLTAAGNPIKGTQLSLWGAGDQSGLTVPLPPGRYVMAVRSYESSGRLTGNPVFGHARYALTAEF